MNAKGRFFWTERGEIIFAGEDVSTGNECAVSVELPLRTVVLFTAGVALSERSETQTVATNAQPSAAHTHTCAACGYVARNQQALAAHMRTHKNKERNK